MVWPATADDTLHLRRRRGCLGPPRRVVAMVVSLSSPSRAIVVTTALDSRGPWSRGFVVSWPVSVAGEPVTAVSSSHGLVVRVGGIVPWSVSVSWFRGLLVRLRGRGGCCSGVAVSAWVALLADGLSRAAAVRPEIKPSRAGRPPRRPV